MKTITKMMKKKNPLLKKLYHRFVDVCLIFYLIKIRWVLWKCTKSAWKCTKSAWKCTKSAWKYLISAWFVF